MASPLPSHIQSCTHKTHAHANRRPKGKGHYADLYRRYNPNLIVFSSSAPSLSLLIFRLSSYTLARSRPRVYPGPREGLATAARLVSIPLTPSLISHTTSPCPGPSPLQHMYCCHFKEAGVKFDGSYDSSDPERLQAPRERWWRRKRQKNHGSRRVLVCVCATVRVQHVSWRAV